MSEILSPSLEQIQRNIYGAAAGSNLNLAQVLAPGNPEQYYSGIYPTPSNIENQNATQLEWQYLYQWYIRSFLVEEAPRDMFTVASWNFGIASTAFLASKNSLTGLLGQSFFPQEIRPEFWFAGAFSTATVVRSFANATYLINNPSSGTAYGGWSVGKNTSAVPTSNGWVINTALVSPTPLLNTYNQTTAILWGIADFTQVTASNAATDTIPASAQAYQAPLLNGIQIIDQTGAPQGVIGLPYQRTVANTTFRYFPTAYWAQQSTTIKADLEFDGLFTGGESTVSASLVPLGAMFVKAAYYTPES